MYPYSGCIPESYTCGPAQDIIRTVCIHFSVTEGYIMVKDRKPDRVFIKQVLIYLLRKSRITFPVICDTLGLSESNAKKHYRNFKNIMSVEADVRGEVDGLLCLSLVNLAA